MLNPEMPGNEPAPYFRLLKIGAAHSLKQGIKALPGVRALARALNPPRPDPSNGRCAIRDFFVLKEMAERNGIRLEGATVLEIGSGWFPIFSILFAFYGAKKVILTDITPSMDVNTFSEALRFLPQGASVLVEEGAISEEDARHISCSAESASFSDGRFHYIAPFAPESCLLSCDLVVSRTVLEHISEEELRPAMAAFCSLLGGGGCMLHAIDNSDHLSHGRRNISPVNFLTVPRATWKVINAISYPQNRLRHNNYKRLFRDCGCALLEAQGRPDMRALNDAKSFVKNGSIDVVFREYDRLEDLAILDSYFVARRS